MTRIAVFDYGVGNVRSVVRMCEKVGADVILTADKGHVVEADGLIVPGVGDFDTVVRALKHCDGDQLIHARLDQGKPVLGICVGLQIMFSASTERGSKEPGLTFWPGRVEQLRADIIPHMGWSKIISNDKSPLWEGLVGKRFYFAHSYAVPCDSAPATSKFGDESPLVAYAHHGEDFVAAVHDGPLAATQFHPEKSGEPGEQFIRNWLSFVSVQNSAQRFKEK